MLPRVSSPALCIYSSCTLLDLTIHTVPRVKWPFESGKPVVLSFASPAPTEELDGSGSESEELFSDEEEGSSSPLIPFSMPVRSRATGPTGPRKSSSAPCGGDSSTTSIVDDSHHSRHRKSRKVTCLGGLLRIFTTLTSRPPR